MAQQGQGGQGGQGGAGNAGLDPNIQAILAQQHQQNQQQLQLVQQQQQQDQQRAQARANTRTLEKWIAEQEKKVPSCDGSSLRAVRGWLREIHKASARVPAGQNADQYVQKLMVATSTEDLLEVIEEHIAAQAPAQVPHAQLRQHVNQEFLGPDEANVLKEDVKCMHQGAREEIPRYNRRFSKAADYAYPLPRNAQQEEDLTDRYLGSLRKSKLVDNLFAHDPPLVTLQAAMQAATDEYGRQRRRERIQRDARREEPMDVDATNTDTDIDSSAAIATSSPTVRDILCSMAGSIRNMENEIQGLRQAKASGIAVQPAWGGALNPGGSSSSSKPTGDECWFCGKVGHRKAECRKRARWLASKSQGKAAELAKNSQAPGNNGKKGN